MFTFSSHEFLARVHGGTTHFPIALLCASLLFDGVAFFSRDISRRHDLSAAAFYTLLLAVLGAVAAALSGLALTEWQWIGRGPMATHHIFVWPSCGLLLASAGWRLSVRDKASRLGAGLYLAILSAAAISMALAGYWGGEMVIG